MQAPVTGRRVDYAHQQILQQLTVYLDGLYDGDVDALRSTFHPAAMLFAEVRGEIVQKSLDTYLQGVASRESPASRQEPYNMSILSVDIIGETALAKVHVKMAAFNYYNFLSMLKMNDDWVIVNKLFTHIEA